MTIIYLNPQKQILFQQNYVKHEVVLPSLSSRNNVTIGVNRFTSDHDVRDKSFEIYAMSHLLIRHSLF